MSRWEGSSPAKCCNDCNSLVMKARVEGVMKERAKAEGKVDKYEGYEDWFQTAEETDLCCRAGTFAWEEWKHRQLADRAEGISLEIFVPTLPHKNNFKL